MVAMSATNEAASEQPGPDTEVQDAGEQPLLDASAAIDNASADELLEFVTGQAPEKDPEPEAPAATATEQAGEKPPVKVEEAPAAKDTEPPASKPPGRLSVRALPVEQQQEMADALSLVREGKATDVLEALKTLRGEEAKPAAAKEKAEAAPKADDDQDTPPETPTGIKAIEDQLAQLRAERKQANLDYEPEEVDRLTNEIEDTLVSLQEAKAQAAQERQAQERQQSEATTYNDQYQSAVDELEGQYPDSLDDESKFSQLLDDKITAARVRNDPALKDPRFILSFAKDIHELLTPPPSGRAPSPPPPARRPTGEGVAPGHTQAARPTPDQVKARIDSSDPDELLAALAAG